MQHNTGSTWELLEKHSPIASLKDIPGSYIIRLTCYWARCLQRAWDNSEAEGPWPESNLQRFPLNLTWRSKLHMLSPNRWICGIEMLLRRTALRRLRQNPEPKSSTLRPKPSNQCHAFCDLYRALIQRSSMVGAAEFTVHQGTRAHPNLMCRNNVHSCSCARLFLLNETASFSTAQDYNLLMPGTYNNNSNKRNCNSSENIHNSRNNGSRSSLPFRGRRTARGRLCRRHVTAYVVIWLAGNEGMEKNMETTVIGYIGTTIRIHR